MDQLKGDPMRSVDEGEWTTAPSWVEIGVVVISCLFFGGVVAGFLHWKGWL